MSNKADKLRLKLLKEQQKRLKPGECQKYIRLVLDLSVDEAILEGLRRAELQVEIRALPRRNTITWERQIGQRIIQSSNGVEEAPLTEQWQKEDFVATVLTRVELDRCELANIVANLEKAFPGKRFTLIAPKRNNVTNDLIKLQVVKGLSVWQVAETPDCIVTLLKRLTKSIAEAPFSRQKAESLQSFKKYVVNDNKQCVRVEGSSGYRRLWQQHLNRLPMVTLEVAETIMEQYSCPQKLLKAIKENPQVDKEMADLRIKRHMLSGMKGPATAERRMGNVLSSKLLTIYTSRDPNQLI